VEIVSKPAKMKVRGWSALSRRTAGVNGQSFNARCTIALEEESGLRTASEINFWISLSRILMVFLSNTSAMN
jgi:hypothetical protein